MTLKVRLAAMMIVLLLAVTALQFLLTQREQAELESRIAQLSSEVNTSAREVSLWISTLSEEGEENLEDQLQVRFEGRDHSEQGVSMRVLRERTPGGLPHRRFLEQRATEHGSAPPDSVEIVIVDSDVDVDSMAAVIIGEIEAGKPGRRIIRSADHHTVIRADYWVTDDDTLGGDTTSGELFVREDVFTQGPGTWTESDTVMGEMARVFAHLGPQSASDDFAFLLPLPRVAADSMSLVEIRVPTRELTAALAASRRRSVIWMASLLGVGVLGAALVATQFTRPIRTLEQSFRRVEEGDLDHTVEPKRADEMGRLTASFNRMVGRLRESKQIERRLAEHERLAAVGRLAAGVAHEVRNPLNAIQLTMEQMRDKAAPPTGTDERVTFDRYHHTISSEVIRLERLVSSFLDLSRSEHIERERFDLVENLRAAAELFRPDAEKQGITLEMDAPSPMPVDADRARLPAVWNNLLSNAIAATPSGGTIRIMAEGGGDEHRITIADTGAGMSEQELTRMWEPFFSGRPEGTGLGLSIVRSAVERHGGRVEAESTPGEGTVVRVFLPPAGTPAISDERAPGEDA